MPRKRAAKQPPIVSTEKPFNSALRAANRRLEKAIEERALIHERLAMLNVEIPSLERTISVLGGAPTVAAHIQQSVTPIQDIAAHLRSIPDKPIMPTTSLAVPYKEPNFAGMGSVPAPKPGGGQGRELTEDELLPDMGNFQ